ncbi:hypothetical protein NHX12_030122 [Muraenolepis orangiensis]|uniref:Histone H2A n=1 Tax=Muraenolepis orangiensis TaxID=630683 RepID=A0A9Q0IKP4_9TELE|nr:hypothetical protein NHX12_030122 [Muraenolepis orangiensis]
MAGRGKKVGAKPKRPKSKWARAGLVFPVGHVERQLKLGFIGPTVGEETAVYLGAIIQSVCAEVSGNACRDNERSPRVAPRHVLSAVRHDEELNSLLAGATIGERRPAPRPASLSPNKTTNHYSKDYSVRSQES